MTSKNNCSQTSVPIQSGSYSIEIGSDYFIMPDSPGGVSIKEFHVDCKTNGRSFRGIRYNSFMYTVPDVKEEDADFYRWTMVLENGTVDQGIFEIFVSIPEGASMYRRGPYGEENENSNVGVNQEVRAEVHNNDVMSYIPFSHDLYSNNHPNRRQDSGLSSGASHNIPRNNIGRSDDLRYSTSSGYDTQTSGQRERDRIIDILGNAVSLDPDTISNEISSRYSANDHVCRSSLERPSPQGHLAEIRNEDPPHVYHREDEDTDDEGDTSVKHYWENDDERCKSVDIELIPHGEIDLSDTSRPLINSSQREDLHSPVPAEDFNRRVELALQKLANQPLESDHDKPIPSTTNDNTNSIDCLREADVESIINSHLVKDNYEDVNDNTLPKYSVSKDDPESKNNSLSKEADNIETLDAESIMNCLSDTDIEQSNPSEINDSSEKGGRKSSHNDSSAKKGKDKTAIETDDEEV